MLIFGLASFTSMDLGDPWLMDHHPCNTDDNETNMSMFQIMDLSNIDGRIHLPFCSSHLSCSVLCRYHNVCIFNTALWPTPPQIPHLVRTHAYKRFDCKHSCYERKVQAVSVSCLARCKCIVRRWD